MIYKNIYIYTKKIILLRTNESLNVKTEIIWYVSEKNYISKDIESTFNAILFRTFPLTPVFQGSQRLNYNLETDRNTFILNTINIATSRIDFLFHV